MINIKTYQNIGGTILDNQVYPVYFKPFPKTKDYSLGYINRYFVQKTNDLIITEVNKNKYNEISSTVYNKLSIRWIISGPKNNVYKNKILNRIGVTEQNVKILNVSENKMMGIKNYLNNPLEFWNGK
jgi:hypothetical protein